MTKINKLKHTNSKNGFAQNIWKQQVWTWNFYRLFFKTFFTNFAGIFFGFCLPVFLELIVYLVFRKQAGNNVNTAGSIIRGFMLVPAASLGILFLSQTIVVWKKSILLKRIEAMPVSKSNFLIGLILFYSTVLILAMLWVLLWAFIILGVDLGFTAVSNNIFSNFSKQPYWIILTLLLAPATTISIGLLIAGIAKERGSAQGIASLLFFLCMFLGGLFIPSYLLDSNYGFRIFSYFIPLKYVVFCNNLAWNGGLFDHQVLTNVANVPTEFSATWQPPVFAFILIIIMFIINKFTFKFTV